MNRRTALGMLAVFVVASRASLAQPPGKVRRIGVLSPLKSPAAMPSILARLGELGFVNGKNLSIQNRSTDGVEARSVPLARELLGAGCELVIAYGTEQAARALMAATSKVPIVFLAVDYDPVDVGLVKSLRRPGGNVTGIFIPNTVLVGKRLELLREVLPGARRVLAFADPYTREQLKVARAAAERLNIELVTATFTTSPYDFEAGFEKGRIARIEAFILFASPVFFEHRARIAQLVRARRLPSIVSSPNYLEAGFMSYGANNIKAFERAGDIAASILKGANPGDTAIEQVDVFEIVVDQKAAKAIGLKVPNSVLVRADRVIE